MSFFADVDEMPSTEPSSAMQNSATSGQPVAGEGFLVVGARDGERGGGVDGLRWVEVGPPGGEVELTGSGGVLGSVARRGSRRAGRRR